jgi:hypothetical protein
MTKQFSPAKATKAAKMSGTKSLLLKAVGFFND